MRKNSNALTIAVAYIGATLIVLNVALRLPDYFAVILGCYLVCVVISAFILASVLKRLAKRRTAKEKQYLSSIMHNINAMVIIWESNFHYVEVNDVLTASTGYTAADLQDNARNIQKLLPPDAFAPSLQAIINNRDEEFFVTARSGAKFPVIWNTSLMFTEKDKDRTKYIMMSIGLDMSENNKMKEELIGYSRKLADSETKFSMAMDFSGIGLLLKEQGDYRYYLSEQLQKMTGINKEYITIKELLEHIHPGDTIVFDTISAALTDTSGKSEEMNDVEFRMHSGADTPYRWYQYRYSITPAESIMNAKVGGAIIDITKDKEKDTLIEKMAYIDDVTQIYNRNKFMMIGQEIYDCSIGTPNSGIDYWVIVFDIDDFHIINDTCGYLSGNKLLNEFAAVILRSITSGGFGARIGGDNFAVLIKDEGDDALPIAIIDKIQTGLAGVMGDKLGNQPVSCSAGYCKMSDGGDDFAQVLDRAEFSLSLSGDTRGNVVRYDIKIHDKIIQSNIIEKELAAAIDNNELVLYYQPKIDLSDGSLMGMEALIRWIKPDGTVVPPGSFIPVAESSMLITRISEFVLGEACRQNKEWQDKGYPPITVSINLTAVDFYQTNVTESIKNALDKSGLEAQYLDVELTESLALKDIDHAVHQMEEIKSLGVKLSMDDFGTGYSSLSYIQILPITLLKLDRSFVMYLEEDEISREIVSAVIRIAKSKKIETIAEGIETSGQVDILKESGCDLAQGYFFGKPMPADKFEEFMQMKMEESRKKAVEAAVVEQ
ncbi:MAG: EAL domain-containing protein [Oscillospiraceae bacterium]